MKKFEILKSLILIFFVSYAILQYAGRVYSPRGEYFPVFSWALFTSVRKTPWELVIEVAQIGDRKFDPPALYFELPNIFPHARARDITATKMARQLWVAEMRGLPSRHDLEKVLKRRYFKIDEPVVFHISAIRYDSLVRYKTGEILDRKIYGTYSTFLEGQK
ncbi:hypothetical protein [Aestuariicoccus sp. MJ-SS9]|uniref:hypothetical protein n=1 Tax=Aestuariicoccus sp. MJ-SS9 TaxID=3079855 RepID=UPI00291354BE|nr:hypothetical protein [Aestuariicoccus sp. MJ-SS9]MDU8913933.1 hypothetical protein [Aestuariicoccus sp. MJ-SS9]